MSNLIYTLSDGHDVIYISENIDAVVKAGVEWFFSKDEASIDYYTTSCITSFEREEMHDEAPRYGTEVLTFSFNNVPKILKRYSLVQNPNPEILKVLQGLIDAKAAASEKLSGLMDIKEKINKLERQKSIIRDEVQTLFKNNLLKTESAVDYMELNYINNKRLTHIIEKRHEREKETDAIFGDNTKINLKFVDKKRDGDDSEEMACHFCEKVEPLYHVTLTEDPRSEDDYEERATYFSYVCCDCLKENLIKLLTKEKKLKLFQC